MSNLRRLLKVKSEAQRDETDKKIDEMREKYEKKLASYKPPRTAQEWWNVLRDWWPEITGIWRMYIGGMVDTSDEDLLEWRKARNPQIESFCYLAWAKAPDDGYVHSIPGWSVLCDLCSEAAVLYDADNGLLVPVLPEDITHGQVQ